MGKVNTDMLAVIEVTRKMHDCSTVAQGVLNVFDSMTDRIFVHGLDATNKSIGKLSTKPGYFNPKEFPAPKFSGKGKTGKRKFKNGKPHVTTYFTGGYNEAKTAGGRNLNIPGKADMYLTGQLKNSFLPEVECGRRAVIGFSNDLASNKAEGNESHFGTTIFEPTEKEITIFTEYLANA